MANRFCSSFTCAFDDCAGGGGAAAARGGGGGLGELADPWPRIPRAGTDTPAAPRRFAALVLSMPLPVLDEVLVRAGIGGLGDALGAVLRAGRRGGRLGPGAVARGPELARAAS